MRLCLVYGLEVCVDLGIVGYA